MNRARLLAGAVAASAALLIAGCGSSATTASGTPSAGPSSAPPTTVAPVSVPASTSAPASVPASPTPPTTAAPAGPVSPTTSPAPLPSTCAAAAKHAFIHVTSVKSAAGGGLTLTGNPATLICGGPDDSHYNVASTTETAQVTPGASITVFPLSKMQPEPIAASKLASYLATDEDTRIFLVTGPLTKITGLQEQFHP